MNHKLQQTLQSQYPKLFKNIDENSTPFTKFNIKYGEGWLNLLDTMCQLIQNHVNYTRDQRAKKLRYFRAMTAALYRGNITSLKKIYTYKDILMAEQMKYDIDSYLNDPKFFNVVDNPCSQVYIKRIFEQANSLRIHYSGGDEYVSGIIKMTEAYSLLLCSRCGADVDRRSTVCTGCHTELLRE